MDRFSKALREIICHTNVKIQILAKESGVDRTLIQKMIKGDRVPADKEILDKLIEALMLSPRQTKQLREAYHIGRIGEDTYQRHLLVKDMLEGFSNEPVLNDIAFTTRYEHSFINATDTRVFNGSKEINPLLKAVLEAEASKTGSIKMLIQPEYEFLFEILAILGGQSFLQIEHIFCLQEQSTETNHNKYNLNCIKKITPLLSSGCEYTPYIYYEDIPSHLNNASIFPYIIITQTQVVTLSYDFNTAILYQNTSFLTLFNSVFHNLKGCTTLLMSSITPLPDSCEQYHPASTYVDTKVHHITDEYSLYAQPCFCYFCDKNMIDKYVIDTVKKAQLNHLYEQRYCNYLATLEQGHEFTSYFTLEGIQNFWNNGRFLELPEDIYRPLEKEDCLTILKRLYDKSLETNIHFYLINKVVFNLPRNLIISAAGDNSVSIIYTPPQKNALHYKIKEKSLATSLCSYLKFLKHSDAVFSEESTLELLKNQIEIYTNELNS